MLLIDEHNGTFVTSNDIKVEIKRTYQCQDQDIRCIKCGESLPLITASSVEVIRQLEGYDWMHSECYKALNDNDLSLLREDNSSNINELRARPNR